MSKITEYEVASAFDANDVLLKDGENGTMIISVENAAQEFKRLGGIDDDISGINQSVTQAMDTISSNIAGVETDYIASKDYAIGDLFIVSNVLYKATAAIAEEDVIDTEINCAVVNLGDEIGDIRSELANKANVDGSYSTLTAGNAEQLVGTVFTEDDAAYTFRTSGGSADIGDREYDEIVGGSIVWNQHSQANRPQVTVFTSITSVIENGVARIWGTLGGTGSTGDFRLGTSYIPIPANHVLFLDTGLTDNIVACRIQGKNSGKRKNNTIIKLATTDSAVYDIIIDVYGNVGDEIDITFKPQLFDLTQMFGSKIADYIYNLERTTPGAGVAWFRKYFPKDYYEYNAGELMHVSDLQSHDMVGFNAFDASTAEDGYMFSSTAGIKAASVNPPRSCELVPVLPNTTYYLKSPRYENVWNAIFLDIDKNGLNDGKAVASGNSGVLFTTPANCYYVGINMLTADKGEINLNLSWDGERDGEYEPYVKHSYPLDSSLTLRGIPKLSTDGQLYYDGDHYKSDGTVERRYLEVKFGPDLTVSPGVWFDADASKNTWGFFYNYGETIIPSMIKGFTPSLSDKFIWSRASVYTTDAPYIFSPTYTTAPTGYIGFRIPKTAIETPSDAADLKNKILAWINANPFSVIIELAEPTTEEAQPFQSPQIVDDFGTEEYVTSSIVPVGHITQYDSNLRAKLEMAPNSPDGDGDYLVRQTGGKNEYVPYTDGGRITALESKIPAAPSANGSYILKCTVTDGTATYAWVAE